MALKTLVDCKPSEFLKQTNRIRKSVEKWITDTDIMNIRKRIPVLEKVADGATLEQKAEAVSRNNERRREQARKNLSAMLDAMLEQYPDETLEVLALCCFVEPENVDDYSVSEYLSAVGKIVSDEAVLGFFISLARLGQTSILTR